MRTREGREELVKLSIDSVAAKYYGAGCTATVVLVTDKEIICANAGDSRTVLSENGKAIDLSIDHKPDDIHEKRRIRKAGGYVQRGRVNGILNLSRALGDFYCKDNPHIKAED